MYPPSSAASLWQAEAVYVFMTQMIPRTLYLEVTATPLLGHSECRGRIRYPPMRLLLPSSLNRYRLPT